MKYKIYKLVYKGEVIYVGYTTSLLKFRFDKKHPSIPIEIKKESSIELIEETDDRSKEEYWRKYYEDLGCNLYNKRRGDGYDPQKCLKWGSLRGDRIKNNNKEKQKQYSKKYYDENKERLIEKSIEYYKNNKENVLNRQREYNKRKIIENNS